MANQKPSYRELREKLDTILEQIRSNELDVEQAAKAYEKAAAIVDKLEVYLDETEAKITKINPKSGK